MTKEHKEKLAAFFATFANCERISGDKEPGSLSLDEIQVIGTEGLNAIDTMAAV